MNNLIVITFKKLVLLILLVGSAVMNSWAAKISIKYERPLSAKYLTIYKTLKSNHQQILGESARYLQALYNWPEDIEVVIASCGFVNSRFQPDDQSIVICYETLYNKVFDYPEKARQKEQFTKRVFQNTMFTFWHEVGHALMDQYGVGKGLERIEMEGLADEFATLSLIWRTDEKWRDVVMISALHFKGKVNGPEKEPYESHSSDELRYQKMIALLYGFAQKSYSKLEGEVSRLDWLNKTAPEYYLERSDFWEQNLRMHTRRDFFNN